MRWEVFPVLFLMSLTGTLILAQDQTGSGKDYPDGHGRKVFFPLGDISFADEVVSFAKGKPSAAKSYSQPEQGLGVPDYEKVEEGGYLTLGCGGTLILRFADNALLNTEGPDLYVFEIGPDVEPIALSISQDGQEWIEVGKISGGRADVDIAPFTQPGEIFHFVRLTDLKSACNSRWPGADIDAVGAIGSALQMTLQSSVLFDFDKWTLKPEAKKELHNLALEIRQYPGARIVIEGHTDSIGSIEYNQGLSEKRAAVVRDYLLLTERLEGFDIEIRGYGERRPIAPNDTEEGRQKNRRVSTIVVPRTR